MSTIRNIFVAFFIVLVFTATAQDDYNLPQDERRPYYQLMQYPRGYDKDSLQVALELLLIKPYRSWSYTDSLDYFFTLIAVEDFDNAYVNYKKIGKINPRNQDEFHLIQYLFSFKRKYYKVHFWLDREEKEYPDMLEIIEIRKRLHNVQERIVLGDWNEEDSLIFPILYDLTWESMSKGSDLYLDQMIPLIRNFDLALRDETKFEFQSNRALAMSFYEYGIFLKKYLSTTDAFIALSIARYYDKFNAKITEKYREIRSSMNKKNLIFPSMREIFPKQNKGIFNIENIKKRNKEARDSVVQSSSSPISLQLDEIEKMNYLSGKRAFIFILIGLILLLLYVAIFVKAKK